MGVEKRELGMHCLCTLSSLQEHREFENLRSVIERLRTGVFHCTSTMKTPTQIKGHREEESLLTALSSERHPRYVREGGQ